MSLHQKFTKEASLRTCVSSEPEGLSLINKLDCAAAIWRRTPLKSFQDWINAQIPENLPSARMILPPQSVPDALCNIMDVSGLQNDLNRKLLIEDMSALAHIFADIMQTPYLRLRLKVVSKNACPTFHVNNFKARLICTYRGTGTQYGKSENGSDPKIISNLSTGSVMIIRGTHWPKRPNFGLLHRSPPIQNSGKTRLVLVLDPSEEMKRNVRKNILH